MSISSPDFDTLARRFDAPGVLAIVLMGSFARNEAGPFSDIDLVRFTAAEASPPAAGSHLIAGRLVVVSDVPPAKVETCFTDPEAATTFIAGLRSARPLIDREGTFDAIQRRAGAFVWDAAMQERANAYVSQELVGWIEEVHKGLEGLRRGDIGRMLNARFGLTWGLTGLVKVYRGVLIAGDNDIYQATAHSLGVDSEWVRLRRIAYGLEDESGQTPTLARQIRAGLRLYVLTARMMIADLAPPASELVPQTVALIERKLAGPDEEQ